MIRNLKVFGLALVAAFAMSALVASAASANAASWFTSDGDWTTLSGTQGGTPDTFTTHAGTLSCSSATYTGSTSATTTTTMKLAPSYSGCSLSPLPGHAIIDMNGCEYEFHTDGQETTGGVPNGKFKTETTIVCPTTTSPSHVTHDITVTVTLTGIPKCTIHIEEQNLGTGIVLTNAGGGLSAAVSFSNIKYTQTAGTGEGKCTTTTTTSNGGYSGSATISGQNTATAATTIGAS